MTAVRNEKNQKGAKKKKRASITSDCAWVGSGLVFVERVKKVRGKREGTSVPCVSNLSCLCC